GATGAVIAQFFAYDPGFRGGVSVAGADMNGDGRADIVTGAGPGGGPHVKVFNGAWAAPPEAMIDIYPPPFDTHTVLLSSFFAYDVRFRGGVSVAAGDVNGDGKVDLVTAAGPGGGPHVRIWDGLAYQLLNEYMAYDPGLTSGLAVAVGDF